jgi:hypothetical protein
MDFFIDYAAKFGAAAAPVLGFFLWREIMRNDRLETTNTALHGEVKTLAEKSLTAMLETKHTMETFGSIIAAKK